MKKAEEEEVGSVGGGGGPDQQQQEECVCVLCVCACDSGHDRGNDDLKKCEKSVWWPREEDKIQRNWEPCSGFSVVRNQEFQGAPPGEVVSARGKEAE